MALRKSAASVRSWDTFLICALECRTQYLKSITISADNGLGGCGRNQCFGGTVTGGVDLGAGVIEPPHADSSTGGWSHAEKICKDVGARLCTVAEMKSEVGRGTGCQHDGDATTSRHPSVHRLSDFLLRR